jgi:hypothetical protein
VQNDGAFEIGGQGEVAQQLGHPVVAAAADEADARFGHTL